MRTKAFFVRLSVLLVAVFLCVSAVFVIPDTAVIQGTFRSKSREEKDRLMDRIMEISMQAAASYPMEVSVGGATVFVTDIERFEKI